MAGVDTIRGIAFQFVQTLSDVVDLVVDGEGDAVVIEGAADVVDYEVLDRRRRTAVRQAKTQRQQPGTRGARELAGILCVWGEVENSAEADFVFVTDASLNDSGRRLHELIKDMQLQARRGGAAVGGGDHEPRRDKAASPGRGATGSDPHQDGDHEQRAGPGGDADPDIAEPGAAGDPGGRAKRR